MSQKELQRVKVMENAAGGRLSVREASRLLHLSERQVQRLKRRYQPDSIDWVHHGNLGRVMPWAVLPPQKQLILTLARGKYVGFNDSHLTEKLCAEEGLALSRESVRRILRAAKLASPQKRRPRQYRSRRPPRPRFGMMALTDASRHDWLEGRGPVLTLIGFQDDVTDKSPSHSSRNQLVLICRILGSWGDGAPGRQSFRIAQTKTARSRPSRNHAGASNCRPRAAFSFVEESSSNPGWSGAVARVTRRLDSRHASRT